MTQKDEIAKARDYLTSHGTDIINLASRLTVSPEELDEFKAYAGADIGVNVEFKVRAESQDLLYWAVRSDAGEYLMQNDDGTLGVTGLLWKSFGFNMTKEVAEATAAKMAIPFHYTLVSRASVPTASVWLTEDKEEFPKVIVWFPANYRSNLDKYLNPAQTPRERMKSMVENATKEEMLQWMSDGLLLKKKREEIGDDTICNSKSLHRAIKFMEMLGLYHVSGWLSQYKHMIESKEYVVIARNKYGKIRSVETRSNRNDADELVNEILCGRLQHGTKIIDDDAVEVWEMDEY